MAKKFDERSSTSVVNKEMQLNQEVPFFTYQFEKAAKE